MTSRPLAKALRNWRTVLILLPLAVGLRVLDPWPVEQLRLKLFDAYQEIQPREILDTPVVVVDIDEASLADFGQWPWPRSLLAQLVGVASAAGATALGFDILFPDQDRLSPENLIRLYDDLPVGLDAALGGLPPNDRVLADSLTEAKAVLGLALSSVPGGADSPPPRRAAIFERGTDARNFLPDYPGVTRNIELLAQRSQGQGVVSRTAPRDTVVRRLPALVQAQETLLPALAIEMLRVGAGEQSITVFAGDAGIEAVSVAGRRIPTDAGGQIWPHFSRHDGRRFVSAGDILRGRVPASVLTDKYVLVGATAVGLSDVAATPVGAAMAGVEIHAQLLETLLTGALLDRPSFAIAGEVAVLVIVCLSLAAAHARRKAVSTIGFFVLLCATVLAASWLAFAYDRTLIDASFTLLAAVVLYLFLVSEGFLREETARRLREQRLRDLQDELITVGRISAMGQLSSALAHELNQPLTAIINYVQAGRRLFARSATSAERPSAERPATAVEAGTEAPPSAEQEAAPGLRSGETEQIGKLMEKTLIQAERAGNIIRGLRSTFEQQDSVRAPEALSDVVGEAMLLGLAGAAARRVAVATEIPKGLPAVDVDRIQVQQVVVNLIRNAVEAVADLPTPRIQLSAALQSPDWVEVAVADSGNGLAPEVQKHLFQPFVTTKDSGMGIGLSVSRSIIEAHGGELWLTETPLGGAAFHFTLPVARRERS